ncbi:small ubiquitin-related modifier 2-like [Lagenorhynchus albirostris]|uniref:small ubiquitin-related modifier 2-like n=1 Tax=Lagenorhynchus albirostris TaxID=27610 RepID=UPI0028E5FB65|nr:small ubiquitin-related modifier 2-like [Lagenorhynchus albirostris]
MDGDKSKSGRPVIKFLKQNRQERIKAGHRAMTVEREERSLFTNALSPSASLNCHLIPDTNVRSPGLEEKPKEGVKIENNDHTNLKMAGMDGSLVHFKIKRHTALSKLMKPIVNDRLEMKDEDATDVFQQQIGGVY